jgi:hypothetical protein
MEEQTRYLILAAVFEALFFKLTPDLTTWSTLNCSDKNSSLNSEYGFLVNISMKTFINCGCLKALFMNTLYNSKDKISSIL